MEEVADAIMENIAQWFTFIGLVAGIWFARGWQANVQGTLERICSRISNLVSTTEDRFDKNDAFHLRLESKIVKEVEARAKADAAIHERLARMGNGSH